MNEQSKPLIQIDNVLREMTDEEYAQLLADGWKPDPEQSIDDGDS